MSKNEWESGTLKLPTAEFAKVRKAVEATDRRTKEAVFDHTQRFWKSLTPKQKRDRNAYSEAVRTFCYGADNHEFVNGQWVQRPRTPAGIGDRTPDSVVDDTYDRLSAVLRQRVENERGWTEWQEAPPRRVLKTDMDYPTNRTTSFYAGEEAYITFDRDASTVHWEVHENNHAVERAHEHPHTRGFFDALSKVRWTRGTGGVIAGNDEYNSESRDVGGGANYPTYAIGPLGEAEAPFACVEYLDSKGRRRTRQQMTAKALGRSGRTRGGGGQGRVQAGTPTGGQFTGRFHGESSTYLR